MKTWLMAAAIGTITLASCSTAQISTVETDLNMVATDIDNGFATVATVAVPSACQIDELVYVYASMLESTGVIPVSAAIKGDIAALGSIYTNPLCVAALNGQPVTNPLLILADIQTAIAAIADDTSGKVTASTAVTAPATVTLRHQMLRRASHLN